MDEQTYMKERVDDQFNWYDRKSTWNQQRYKRFRLIATVLSVSIPVITGFITEDTQWVKYAVGVAGAVIAICEYLISSNKYQENWVEYRITAEGLKREKLLYETGSGIYKDAKNPFNTFVVEVEKIMAKENTQWKEYITKKDKEPEEES